MPMTFVGACPWFVSDPHRNLEAAENLKTFSGNVLETKCATCRIFGPDEHAERWTRCGSREVRKE